MATAHLESLERKHYVATPADIEALTKDQLTSIMTTTRTRVTYLRALVATTQSELGIATRERQGRVTKLDEAGIKAQLTALETVHDKFYAAVLTAIDSTPLEPEDRPTTGRTSPNAIRTRRATFARTAKAALKSWIKAGRDISQLAAAKVTKASITVASARKARVVSVKRLITRAEKQSKELVTTLLALAETDKQAALGEFTTLMGIFGDQLETMGVHATRDTAEAVAQGRPLRIKGHMFLPTQTQVVRAS